MFTIQYYFFNGYGAFKHKLKPRKCNTSEVNVKCYFIIIPYSFFKVR